MTYIPPKRDEPRRKRPELFAHVQPKEVDHGSPLELKGSTKSIIRVQNSGQRARQQFGRAINPDTDKPFHDPRSKVVSGRVICKGADMKDLRERVGKREGEICQRCDAFAQLYPPEGFNPGELHHIHGRGLGGGKRDDRASECEWLCGGPSGCHAAAKIKKRIYSGVAE